MDLNEHIEKNNINKTELCKYLGITRSTLHIWLSEKKTENIEKIKNAILDLAKNYAQGITPNQIITNSQVIEKQTGGNNTLYVNENPGNWNYQDLKNESEYDEFGNLNKVKVLLRETELLKDLVRSRDRVIDLLEKRIQLLERENELLRNK